MARHVREESIEGAVVHAAERAGWLVRKLSWIGRVGAPDRLFIRGGRVVFIEFKRPRAGRLSAAQRQEIRRLSDAGAEVYVVDDVDYGKRLLGLE